MHILFLPRESALRQTDPKCFSKGLEHLEQVEIIDFVGSWIAFVIGCALFIHAIEWVCDVTVFVAPEKMDSIFVIAKEWDFIFASDQF